MAMLYVVKPNDSWLKIANLYGTTPAALAALNAPLTSSSTLYVGQSLNVPMVPSSVAVSKTVSYDVVVKQGNVTTVMTLTDHAARQLADALRGADSRDETLIVRRPV